MLVIPVLVFPATAGAAATLDVKPGQWEMTSAVETNGPLLSPQMLAAIPPEARAQMDAALESMKKPHVSRTCLTAEKLARGFDTGDSNASCPFTATNVTSRVIEMRARCGLSGAATDIQATFTAVNREAMTGEMQVNATSPGLGEGAHHTLVHVTGRYLGPCDGSE